MVTESKMESKTMSQELQSVMNAFLGHGNDGRYTENKAGFKGCGIWPRTRGEAVERANTPPPDPEWGTYKQIIVFVEVQQCQRC